MADSLPVIQHPVGHFKTPILLLCCAIRPVALLFYVPIKNFHVLGNPTTDVGIPSFHQERIRCEEYLLFP
jgi:hypothetical protein